MKYALFLQRLALSESETIEEFRRNGCRLLPIWRGQRGTKRLANHVHALVTRKHQTTARQIDNWMRAYPRLKMLSFAFTGYDDVPLQHCAKRGLFTYYCPGYSTQSVAELTVALTLSVLRRIPKADGNVRDGAFDGGRVQPGVELSGQTVGILGTGTIGMASAHLFRSFGCRLLGWTPHPRKEFRSLGGKYVSRPTLLRRADVIVLHLALNDETSGLVDYRALRLMQKHAILINTARAGLVDTGALVAALTKHRIAGAGIDVYDNERALKGTTDHSLLRLPNVVLTPHLGFKTRESLVRLAKMAIANIGRWRHGDATNRLCKPAIK